MWKSQDMITTYFSFGSTSWKGGAVSKGLDILAVEIMHVSTIEIAVIS